MDHPPTISRATARWIQDLMTTKGYSVRAFADATQIPRGTLIRRFESAPHNFTIGELESIARVLGIKVSDIAAAGERDAA